MQKKYSINWKDDEVVSVEVDGIQYESVDQIPDPEDRDKILLLMSKSGDEDFDEGFDETFDKEFEEEFRELERMSARAPTTIVAVFMVVGVILLAIAIFSAVRTSRAISNEVGASGRVVELVVRRDPSGNETYYPVVEFRLPDGTSKTVQLSEGSWPPAYETGQVVTVLYDPANPLDARIQSSASTTLRWIFPSIMGIVGLVFMAAALAVWWFFRPATAQPEQQELADST